MNDPQDLGPHRERTRLRGLGNGFECFATAGAAGQRRRLRSLGFGADVAAAVGAFRVVSISGPLVTFPSGSVRCQLRNTRGRVPATRIVPELFVSPGAKMFSNSRQTTA